MHGHTMSIRILHYALLQHHDFRHDMLYRPMATHLTNKYCHVKYRRTKYQHYTKASQCKYRYYRPTEVTIH